VLAVHAVKRIVVKNLQATSSISFFTWLVHMACTTERTSCAGCS
jgi:hypothetical protein